MRLNPRVCAALNPFRKLAKSISLWGNPAHLSYIASALRDKYPEDKLHILVAKNNSGSFTYDGIEVGGERVTKEIEDTLEILAREGQGVQKLSIVGYSLGGLVARYAVGLLYSNGWFERIQPVNFTTFASPHLGVRTPLVGYHSQAWNAFGSRTLSTSGRQLFTIDTFRDTGRPLLAVLADPNSIFIKALSQFKNRVLYANVINDRSAPYYTTYITCLDPYVDTEAINISYLKNYEPVIIDPSNAVSRKVPSETPSLYTRLSSTSQTLLNRVPMFAMLAVIIPIGTLVFLVNSGVQSIRSQQRIRLHEQGKAGIGLGSYRIPLMIENAQSAMEGAFENMNAGQTQEYLPASIEEVSVKEEHGEVGPEKALRSDDVEPAAAFRTPTSTRSKSEFPTLALSAEQFAMIDALDAVGFRKHPVYIHQVTHSHAAIIVRTPRKGFEEGKVVMRHWINEEFEI